VTVRALGRAAHPHRAARAASWAAASSAAAEAQLRMDPVLAALVVLLCAGCGNPASSTQEKPMDPQAELAARPTLEEITARYDEMLQRIRDRHTMGGIDTTVDAYYDFGTKLGTTLRVTSGCHRSINPTPWAPATTTPGTP
jgi:hypothetical protein